MRRLHKVAVCGVQLQRRQRRTIHAKMEASTMHLACKGVREYPMCQLPGVPTRARALEHMTSFCVFSHVRTEATMSERQCELHDRIKTLCSEGKGNMVKKAAAGLAILMVWTSMSGPPLQKSCISRGLMQSSCKIFWLSMMPT